MGIGLSLFVAMLPFNLSGQPLMEPNQLRILDCGLRRAQPSRLQIDISDVAHFFNPQSAIYNPKSYYARS